MLSNFSFADVTVVPSKINGQAIISPDGALQIFDLSITIDHITYNLGSNLITGLVACQMLGKTSFRNGAASNTLGMNSYGQLNFTGESAKNYGISLRKGAPGTVGGFWILTSLTCD